VLIAYIDTTRAVGEASGSRAVNRPASVANIRTN
jgi:hypothetical protein